MEQPIVTANSLTISGSLLTPAYMAPFRPKYESEMTFGDAFNRRMHLDRLDSLAQRYGFESAEQVENLRRLEKITRIGLLDKIRGVTPEKVSEHNRLVSTARSLWEREV